MDSETLRRAEAVAREIMALRAEVERLTESERSLQAQVELGEAYESRLLAEVERLRALIKRARPYVQAYAVIICIDEVSLDASETAKAMRLSGPT